MSRVYGYARVSTAEQFSSRLSIDEQRRRIIDFCEKEGLDLGANNARLGEEAASAYKLRFDARPLGRTLNANMVKGDHIVIAKLDRAFRDMLDAVKTVEFWHAKGIVPHILDIPSGGAPIFDKLILGMLAWCAEFESHRKSERMIDAYCSARRRGKPMRQCAPLGFRWVGSRKQKTHALVYFPNEREHMQLCYELWMEHGLSTHEIASYLMGKRVKPYDKRAPDAIPRSKIKVSQDYHPRRIGEMVRREAEFRFYEAQGLTPAEAAAAWLKNWGTDTLPTEAQMQQTLNSDLEQIETTKGGSTCAVQHDSQI